MFIVQVYRQKNLFAASNYNLPPAAPVGLRVSAANDGVVGIEWYKTLSDDEITFHSSAVKKIIEVDYNSYYLSAYKKYYLRIITYTDDNKAPNSYFELTDFTIISK